MVESSEGAAPVAPFALSWTIFGVRGTGEQASEFQVSADGPANAGDQIKIVFSPSADGFAYVVAKDARGVVHVLFPSDALKGASRVKAGQVYQAPLSSAWWTVDAQPGASTVYIIGCYDPLQNLEELVEQPEAETTAVARRDLIDSTINGLIDGRHYQTGRRVSTRKTNAIDPALAPGPRPIDTSVTAPGGLRLTHRFVSQPGLLAAEAEATLRVGR